MRDLILFAAGIFLFIGVVQVGPKAIKLANLWLDKQIAEQQAPTAH